MTEHFITLRGMFESDDVFDYQFRPRFFDALIKDVFFTEVYSDVPCAGALFLTPVTCQ